MVTIGIVGAGKVGSALARLWFRQGVPVAAVASLDRRDAERLAGEVSAQAVQDASAVISLSDLTVICVHDDALAGIAAAASTVNLTGKAVVHTSGVHGADVLEPLRQRGALVGGLHPAHPFAAGGATPDLRGTVFAVETSSSTLQGDLERLVRLLGGQPMVIAPGGKSLYHAALVIASNYSVVLYAIAERLLIQAGAQRAIADAALNALMEGTVQNLREVGIPGALTGPLTRGDAETVRRHLSALTAVDPAVADVYVALARQAYGMLKARGIDTQNVEHILQTR